MACNQPERRFMLEWFRYYLHSLVENKREPHYRPRRAVTR